MKKLLLLTLLTLSSLVGAQTIPWQKDVAMPIVLRPEGQLIMPVYHYLLLGSAFKEIEGYIAEIQGKPQGSVKVSPEYIEYRFGSEVMYRDVIYTPKFNDPFDMPEEAKAAFEQQREGKLDKKNLTGPNWIHMVQAIDVEEVNCLAISRKNGVSSGCADLWQEGISEDEAVCFKGKTYLKCHVECIEKIYNRKVETVPGFCPEVKPESTEAPAGETTHAN